MPYPVCDDMHQLEHAGRLYWLRITVTAQLTGEEPAGGLPPVRADLGRRVADLIRADCADAAREIPVRPRAQPCRCSLLPLADEVGPET